MKKVCIITAARSEYGLLRWVIDAVHRDPQLELQLVATGMHLSPEYGNTYREIEADGYPIASKMPVPVSSGTRADIARSMGACLSAVADEFERLDPDITVVLGDRYELLPLCSAALVMEIPIAHVSGGDITEGAIDNEIRNAVTCMASLHFPGNDESARNVERITGSPSNVWNVGEPGLENFRRLELITRAQLAASLGMDASKKWVMLTLHPETRRSLEHNEAVARNVVKVLSEIDGIEVVITKSNADFGGEVINGIFSQAAREDGEKFKMYDSLGQLRYLSFLDQSAMVIGNSSSGIVEAPMLGVPVVNIGDRQKGRYMAGNITNSGGSEDEILAAVRSAADGPERLDPDYYYGDGEVAGKIVEYIKEYLG